jgi:DNA-binding response OmpR family regulator
MRVLLVDDEMDLVSTLAERLSFREIEADWATNADAAMELVRQHPYDLAVLDVKMPVVNGLQLKKWIEKQCPDMKFIFLTGHGSEDDFRLGIAEAGCDNYLIKPVNIEILIAKMNEALQ